ncbi:hypothetical protein [Clostridium sp.]|uniref:hypothetical protein n=1 Tax=Clostridium sp. TaxID=1506 RepID=UPI0028416127|nr:hypothetical protein [Clostridium sp.]MDR3596837.1 hypothetical protein [Clostridium sp.]
MSKKKIPHALNAEGYSIRKISDENSSEAEASDTENYRENNNLSADDSNTSRPSLQSKSIDLNDDDDNDDKM